jgi:hypothetical protein
VFRRSYQVSCSPQRGHSAASCRLETQDKLLGLFFDLFCLQNLAAVRRHRSSNLVVIGHFHLLQLAYRPTALVLRAVDQ